MASEAISECLIFKIFLGEHAPRPPSLFTRKRTQWPYQSKIAGSGPAMCGGESGFETRMCIHYTSTSS